MPVAGDPYDYENIDHDAATGEFTRVRPQSTARPH
jgi:hypothetical protein